MSSTQQACNIDLDTGLSRYTFIWQPQEAGKMRISINLAGQVQGGVSHTLELQNVSEEIVRGFRELHQKHRMELPMVIEEIIDQLQPIIAIMISVNASRVGTTQSTEMPEGPYPLSQMETPAG